MSTDQASGSITLDTEKIGKALASAVAPLLTAIRQDVADLRVRLGSRVLPGDELISTLANHLPAAVGVTGTDWTAPGVAAFLADRLHRAGYALIELDGRRLGDDPATLPADTASPFPADLDSRLRSFFGDQPQQDGDQS